MVLIIKFTLGISHASATPPCLSLSRGKPVTNWLLLRPLLTLAREMTTLSLLPLLSLAIVIEVIEHEIQIRVHFLSQMILDLVLSVY